jgi:predicted dehydrogenase
MSNRCFNRRRFLEQTAAAVAFPYVVSASALGKTDRPAPSERITLAGIGVGGQGLGNMTGNDYSEKPAGGFLGQPDVQVVAVCDVDQNHLEQAQQQINKKYGNNDCAAFHDFRDLLSRDDIDAVMIATPDHWHALIAVAAAKAGKHIYLEKPLAYSVTEGRAVCDAVKKYGVIFQSGSQQRSWRDFRFAAELVRNGRIGKVRRAWVGLPHGRIPNVPETPDPVPEGFDYDFWLGPAPYVPYCDGRCHNRFRMISDYSGGPVTDWAGHHIDSAQWAMGTDHTGPVEVTAQTEFLTGGLYDVTASYRFEYKYAEGLTLIVSDNLQRPDNINGIKFTPGLWGLNIGVLFEGSDGWIQVNRGGLDVYPASLRKTNFGPDEIHLYKSADHKRNFLDCIKSRSQTASMPEPAQRAITVAQLGIIAAKLGRKLAWDPKNEHFIGDQQADRMLSRPFRSPWRL